MRVGKDVLAKPVTKWSKKMLKQRVITALLLLPVVLAGVLLLSTNYFSIFWAAVLTIAGYEWLKLSGIETKLFLFVGVLVLNVLFVITWFYSFPGFYIEWIILIAWVLVVIGFIGDPVARFKRLSPSGYSLSGIAIGLMVVFPTWLAMVLLHQQNPWMVLYVFGIVSVADIGAYFSGRRFGKRKLAPAISPGKSWEGVCGALFAVTIYSSLVAYFLKQNESAWLFVLISLIAAVASVAGDLLESVFKRARGVKDSGTLLPGHGGIMDRLDSITAAAPVFTATYFMAGWL